MEERFLWDAVRALHSGTVLEIGSYEGYSTIILAKALVEGEVYAVDPHVGLPCQTDSIAEGVPPFREVGWPKEDSWTRFGQNIKETGVSHVVKPLKMASEEAVQDWTQPIHVLWIDGSHRYEDVRKDVLLWRPHVADGGLIVLHDCWISGVSRVLGEFVLSDRSLACFGFRLPSMFYARVHHRRPIDFVRIGLWRVAFAVAAVYPRLTSQVVTQLRRLFRATGL
jgi:hypothetical protein